MQHYLHKFERYVYYALIVLLSIVIVLSVLELVWLIITTLSAEPFFRLDNRDFLKVFGFFLLVFIGLELLATIRAYITKHVIEVEEIILLAIIAIARKVIILDYTEEDFTKIIGIGLLFIALCTGHYLLKKGGTTRGR